MIVTGTSSLSGRWFQSLHVNHCNLKEDRLDVFVDLHQHLDDNQAKYTAAIKSFIYSYVQDDLD